MIIYPAIDIKDNKCVRLCKGVYEDTTVYFENPLDAAKKWQADGTKYLHLVDLDGARYKQPYCKDIILAIAKETGLFIEIGGGIRTYETAKEYLQNGISRVIFGTPRRIVTSISSPKLYLPRRVISSSTLFTLCPSILVIRSPTLISAFSAAPPLTISPT